MRLSVVLLLASFTNYASLPSRAKRTPTAVVAQVEEIQEAVAVPAARGAVRQGVAARAPPVPQLNTDSGNNNNKRMIEAAAARPPIQRGNIRKRRRAASQGKPTGGVGGNLVSGSIVKITRPTVLPAVPLSAVHMGKVPRNYRNTANYQKTNSSRASKVQKPTTISMPPGELKNLQFSL